MEWLQECIPALLGLQDVIPDATGLQVTTFETLITKGIGAVFAFSFHIVELIIAHKIAGHPSISKIIAKIVLFFQKLWRKEDGSSPKE